MKTLLRSLVVVAVLGAGAAFAQVRVEVALPTIHFAVRPPLVTVQTGVQVVPDQEEEVFYSGGYYWTRRDARWYRCRHDWRWQPVEVRYVPVGLSRIPPGHYRHWHGRAHEAHVVPAAGHPVYRHDEHHRDHDRDHDWDDRHDDHHDDHGDHGHGHGHGHGHH